MDDNTASVLVCLIMVGAFVVFFVCGANYQTHKLDAVVNVAEVPSCGCDVCCVSCETVQTINASMRDVVVNGRQGV